MKLLYFYAKEGQKIGPLTREQLDDLHLAAETLVWHYGLSNWIPYQELKEEVEKSKKSSISERLSNYLKSKFADKQIKKVEENDGQIQDVEPLTPQKKSRNLSKKRVSCIIFGSLAAVAIVGFIVLAALVNNESYPEYVTGFHNKCLWYFDMDNNSLCEKLISKAEEAKEANMTELERYYYDAVQNVGTNDDDVLFEVALYYSHNDIREYEKALSILNKINHQDRIDVQANMAWCYYKTDRVDEAIFRAQQVYLQDSENRLATITLYCAYDYKKDWKKCIEWADKSIAIDSNFAQTFFIKAYAQYEYGYKTAAKETYNKACAIDPYHKYASTYSYIGGSPFSIVSVDVANVTYNGEIINGYGHKIKRWETQYLKPRLKISPNRIGSFEIKVKLYYDGNLSTGTSSPAGYSYESTVYVSDLKTQYVVVGGWGNESSGHWGYGNYRYEFYFGDKKIGSKSFSITY